MFPIQKKRPCSGHCLFGRLITVSSWSWLQYLFSRTTSQYTSVVIYISVVFNYLYIYVYIYTYIHPTLHYIALHYLPMQYNDSTFTLHQITLHNFTLQRTYQPKSIKLRGQNHGKTCPSVMFGFHLVFPSNLIRVSSRVSLGCI